MNEIILILLVTNSIDPATIFAQKAKPPFQAETPQHLYPDNEKSPTTIWKDCALDSPGSCTTRQDKL